MGGWRYFFKIRFYIQVKKKKLNMYTNSEQKGGNGAAERNQRISICQIIVLEGAKGMKTDSEEVSKSSWWCSIR